MSWASDSSEKESEPMDGDTEISSCQCTLLYPFHLMWRLEQKQDQELTRWICQGSEAVCISLRVTLFSLNLLRVDFGGNFCFFVVWVSTTTPVFDTCTKHLWKNTLFLTKHYFHAQQRVNKIACFSPPACSHFWLWEAAFSFLLGASVHVLKTYVPSFCISLSVFPLLLGPAWER